MTSPKPGRPAGDRDGAGAGDRDRDAEITALLLAELRAATAAARARGATDEQVHRLIEQRSAALRRSLPGVAPGPEDDSGSDAVTVGLGWVAADAVSDAVPEDAEHRGDDPLDLRGIA